MDRLRSCMKRPRSVDKMDEVSARMVLAEHLATLSVPIDKLHDYEWLNKNLPITNRFASSLHFAMRALKILLGDKYIPYFKDNEIEEKKRRRKGHKKIRSKKTA